MKRSVRLRSRPRGSRARSSRSLGALLVGVLAAVLIGPSAASAADPALELSAITAEPGVVRFAVSTRGGAPLDSSQLRVLVGQTPITFEAEPATTVNPELPSRVLTVLLGAPGRAYDSEVYVEAVNAFATSLAASLPADVQIMLVTATTHAEVILPATTDRAAFVQAVTSLDYIGEAPLADGLLLAAESVRIGGFDANGDKRLLVLSDGEDADGSVLTDEVRGVLEGLGLPVDAVGIGASAGAGELDRLARATGGKLVLPTSTPLANTTAAETAKAFSPVYQVTAYIPEAFGSTTGLLRVEAGTLSDSVLVNFADGLVGGIVAEEPPHGWVPGWLLYLIIPAIFLALAAVVLALLWPQTAAQSRLSQIAHFGPARSAPKPKAPAQPATHRFAEAALAASKEVVGRANLEGRLALRLERAGMRLRPHEWLLLRVSIAVALAALAAAFVGGWYGFVGGAVAGWLATMLYQNFRIDRRAAAFAEQLPEALQLLIGSLRSGFSIAQGLETVVREAPEPLASEFGRALAEHRLGADLSESLDAVAQRTKSEDLSWAVMAMRIQREVGGNLAEVLQTTVDTMRERARLRRHARALSAEGRLSAWVLIGIPLFLGLFMFVYRRTYMMPLLTDPRGQFMLLGGLGLFVIGIFWITRVVKVEA